MDKQELRIRYCFNCGYKAKNEDITEVDSKIKGRVIQVFRCPNCGNGHLKKYIKKEKNKVGR
jgi:transposase